MKIVQNLDISASGENFQMKEYKFETEILLCNVAILSNSSFLQKIDLLGEILSLFSKNRPV